MPFSLTGIGSGLAAELGVISTAIGIYATFENQRLDAISKDQIRRLNEQKAEIERTDAKLRGTTADRDYTLAVFKEVKDALVSGEERPQQVSLALVETLPDASLRERLSGAFRPLPRLAPQVQVQAAQINAAAATAVARERLQSYYDVFWCTQDPKNQELATRIVAALGGTASHRVRLREGWTPRLTRVQPGDFHVKTVRNATPGYISIFACQ